MKGNGRTNLRRLVTPESPAPTERSKVKIKKPPVLFHKTQAIIEELSETLRGPVLTIYGDIFSGIVSLSYRLLQDLGRHKKIFVVVCSNGGRGTSSLRLIDVIRQYAEKVVVLAPRECASAATMIALGADEIQMAPLAYLTAVDTSLTHPLSPLDNTNDKVSIELDELHRVIKLWKESSTGNGDNPYKYLYQYIHPLVIGAVDRSSSLSEKLCQEILSHHMKNAKKSKTISHALNSDYPSHGYPITLREAARLGLPVRKIDPKVGAKVDRLMELYYEMNQSARTDFDQENYHNNQISNIVEGHNRQYVYQYDKDWFYRREEKRWMSLNDHSSWHKFFVEKGRIKKVRVHL